MQLTQFTDYSLRVLIYLSKKPEGFATITEMAKFYRVSRNHLVKVMHHLANGGFIHTTRGKHGGMRLARNPEAISIGKVARHTEPNFEFAECFRERDNCCVISHVCGLKGVLQEAMQSFLKVLDRYSIADIISPTTPGAQPILWEDIQPVMSSHA